MSHEPGLPVEIVAVGHELLSGRTVDSNAAWIAARLTDRGAWVRRIVAVDDDPAAVAREIGVARLSGAALVITTGGLGPTADDRTLAGIAGALGRPLAEHPEALAFVARRYEQLARAGSVADAVLSAPRRRMAALPVGSAPVDNRVGSAPGVLVEESDLTVLALPGVPAEMRAVFEAAGSAIAARLGAPRHVVEREVPSGCGDESVITVAVERVLEAMPRVALSLATAFAPGCDLPVRISATAADRTTAEATVAEAAARLGEELARVAAHAHTPART